MPKSTYFKIRLVLGAIIIVGLMGAYFLFKTLSGPTPRVTLHTDLNTSAAFSPDGHTLAIGGQLTGDEAIVQIWDLRTNQVVRTIHGYPAQVGTLMFSPDGTLLAASAVDDNPGGQHFIAVVDVGTGVMVQRLTAHFGVVWSITFSPDGNRVVSTSEDGKVRVWDVHTGLQLLTLKGHKDAVYTADFSPDGKYIATGGLDKTTRLWDGQSGRQLYVLKSQGDGSWQEDGAIEGVRFIPQSTRLMSVNEFGIERIWDMPTRVLVQTYRREISTRLPEFSADRRFYLASQFTTDLLEEAHCGAFVAEIGTHRSWSFANGYGVIYAIALSPDGKTAAVGHGHDGVTLWNLK